MFQQLPSEHQAFLALIQSGDKTNIEIALEIKKGDPSLNKLIVDHCFELIETWHSNSIDGVLMLMNGDKKLTKKLQKRYNHFLKLIDSQNLHDLKNFGVLVEFFQAFLFLS